VFKQSEKTPAIGEARSGAHRAGISAAVIQLLVGEPETGKALVAHDVIDLVQRPSRRTWRKSC
jgi:succinylglutamic semialdehyde dehydrogenase